MLCLNHLYGIYMDAEANEILSLAKLVLTTLNLFPRVTYIGSVLMIMAFTACASAALTKLCVAPESIKTLLQYTCSIFMGNSKSHIFFE